MGNCCFSSITKDSLTSIPRSPPAHPLPEKETVKEVLSETPTIPKKSSPPVVFNSDEVVGPAAGSTRSERLYMATETGKGVNVDHHRKSVTDRVVGKLPSKRFDLSTGRKILGPGRDPGDRPAGEITGLRSRAPAMYGENGNARTGLGRSQSVRKAGKSLDRVRSEFGDKNRNLEQSGSSRDMREKWTPTNSHESLENPLVSLECFIFL